VDELPVALHELGATRLAEVVGTLTMPSPAGCQPASETIPHAS
jgi:hypothetical protein